MGKATGAGSPEEARHADYGIAAGAGEGELFDALLALVRSGAAGRA